MLILYIYVDYPLFKQLMLKVYAAIAHGDGMSDREFCKSQMKILVKPNALYCRLPKVLQGIPLSPLIVYTSII